MAETTRILKARRDALAAVKITEQSVIIAGSDATLVGIDSRGITLKGNISIVADAMNRRVGGLFVGLNDFMHCIPSTMFTPIPSLIPMPPIAGLVNIGKDVAFFTAMLI